MRIYVTASGQFVVCEGMEILDARPATREEVDALVAYMTAEHVAALTAGVRAPHISASGVTVDGSLTLTLTAEPDAEETGNRILREVRSALSIRNKTERVRILGRLVDVCADVVLRIPEVHLFLDGLYRQGHISTIKGILGEPRRGRPRTNLMMQVAIVGDLKRRKLWTKDTAALYARRFSKSIRGVENDHSKYQSLLQLYGSRFVSANELTRDSWQWPGTQGLGTRGRTR